MKGKKLLPLIGSICLAIILAALLLPACTAEEPAPTPTPTPTPVKPLEFRFANFLAESHYVSKEVSTRFAEELEKRTEGRIKVEVYHAQTLCKAKEQYEAVKEGVATFALDVASYNAGVFPSTDVFQLPFAGSNAFMRTEAGLHLMRLGYFDEEFRDVKQLHIAATWPYAFLWKNQRPATLEEMAGLKVRSPGGYASKGLEALGMVPVSLTVPEIFMAFERGIIDCHLHSVGTMVTTKTYEIGESCLVMPMIAFGGQSIIMNLEAWNQLSAGDQKIVAELGEESAHWYPWSSVVPNIKAKDIITKAGVEFYSLSATELEKAGAKAIPVWDMFIADLEGQGKPGKELVAEYVSKLKELGDTVGYSP